MIIYWYATILTVQDNYRMLVCLLQMLTEIML